MKTFTVFTLLTIFLAADTGSASPLDLVPRTTFPGGSFKLFNTPECPEPPTGIGFIRVDNLVANQCYKAADTNVMFQHFVSYKAIAVGTVPQGYKCEGRAYFDQTCGGVAVTDNGVMGKCVASLTDPGLDLNLGAQSFMLLCYHV